MKTAIISLIFLMLTSCYTPEKVKYSLDFSQYMELTDAETVFLNVISKDTSRIVYAEGFSNTQMFEPYSLNEEENYLLDAMIKGQGCIQAPAKRISREAYREVAEEGNINFLILCPVNNIGYVGAGFEELPSVEIVEATKVLGVEISESL